MLMAATTNQPAPSTLDDGLRWYCVRTFSGAEWQARKALLAAGIEAFLPFAIIETRRGRWYHGVCKALFPGYIFCGLDDDSQWPAVRNTIGIQSMDALIRQADEAYTESLGRKAPIIHYRVGDWVAVPSGPFHGLPVRIEAIDKHGNASAYIGSIRHTFHVAGLGGKVEPPFAART